MSGEKRTPVQILQSEMRQNRQELYNIKQQREQLQKELLKARNESTGQVHLLKTQMVEREQRQKVVVDNLKSEMRDMASDHSKKMAEQRDLVLREMQRSEQRNNEKIDNLRIWTSERLTEQRNEYKKLSQQQQQQINELKRNIEHINKREENREERAKMYLSDLGQLIKHADDNTPHERYAPGRMNKIKAHYALAEKNLTNDDPSACIAVAQATHFELMDLEEEILLKETEFELTYRTVADAVAGFLATVRKNRHIQLEGDTGVQEADYWTEGRYSEVEKNIEKIHFELRNNKEKLTIEELNDHLDEIETLTDKQEELIKEAVERIISSQLRADMGDVVVAKLQEQGYDVKANERGYAGADQREAYMVKLTNIAGTEIVTVISPDEKTYENILSINTYNEDVYDDEAKQKRNEGILNSLKSGGIKTGKTECNNNSVSEYYDVGNIIKQASEKIPGNVLRKTAALSGANVVRKGKNKNTE